MAADVEVRIASDPRWLRLVRLVVEGCCRGHGFGEAETRAIVMAINEAATNVIRHAYAGDKTRPIEIACSLGTDSLEIEISDLGREFDPGRQPVLPPDELRSGGRGIYIIRSLVDDLEYERDGGWNRLRLRKRLPQPAASV